MNVVVMTRSKSLFASTLGTLMSIQQYSCVNGLHINIHYISTMNELNKYIKDTSCKLFFMDYGTALDRESTESLFNDIPKGYQCVVYSGAKEGINWTLFKGNPTEKIDQRGLMFDTEIDKPIAKSYYNVTKTDARIWLLDTKALKKTGKTFDFKDMNICAYIDANPVMYYTHECSSNILESSGITATPQ